MYTIIYATGRTDSHDTLQGALDVLRDAHPDLYAIHEVGQDEVSDSDTAIAGERNGHRVLVWASESESTDDTGVRTVASIRRDERAAPDQYAAVGTDGMRDVVWGVGLDMDAAEVDASAQEGVPSDLRYVPITAAAVVAVEAGSVGLDDRGGLAELGGVITVREAPR